MKPKPLVVLKNLTVPTAIMASLSDIRDDAAHQKSPKTRATLENVVYVCPSAAATSRQGQQFFGLSGLNPVEKQWFFHKRGAGWPSGGPHPAAAALPCPAGKPRLGLSVPAWVWPEFAVGPPTSSSETS